MLSASQVRAGRDWRQKDLARLAKVHPRTIKKIERGQVVPQRATMQAIARAFSAAGVTFIGSGGVSLQ